VSVYRHHPPTFEVENSRENGVDLKTDSKLDSNWETRISQYPCLKTGARLDLHWRRERILPEWRLVFGKGWDQVEELRSRMIEILHEKKGSLSQRGSIEMTSSWRHGSNVQEGSKTNSCTNLAAALAVQSEQNFDNEAGLWNGQGSREQAFDSLVPSYWMKRDKAERAWEKASAWNQGEAHLHSRENIKWALCVANFAHQFGSRSAILCGLQNCLQHSMGFCWIPISSLSSWIPECRWLLGFGQRGCARWDGLVRRHQRHSRCLSSSHYQAADLQSGAQPLRVGFRAIETIYLEQWSRKWYWSLFWSIVEFEQC